MAGATRICCHLGAFCVHRTTMHRVTSCKATCDTVLSVLPGHTGVKRNDQADRTGGQSNHHKWLHVSDDLKCRGARDATCEHKYSRSKAKGQGHLTIGRLEERGVDREETLDVLPSKDERGPSHRQSDQHRNWRKLVKDRAEHVIMGFFAHIDTVLN